MNNMYDTDYLRSLPDVLKNDVNISILAKIIADELQKNIKYSDLCIIYPRINELNDDILDILAYDLHVDWYDTTYTTEEKRAIIKNSFKVHKYQGTKYAVETALRDIYPNTNIEEWFSYGGEPYHFKVVIKDPVGDVEKQNEVIKKVVNYKNLRSKIDEIIYEPTVDGSATMFVCVKPLAIMGEITVEVKNYGLG